MTRLTLLALACLLPAAAPAAPVDVGRKVYAAKCAVCHGDRGDGNGPAAHLVWPRPRDLTTGAYKFRSTPSGTLPTDEDLLRVIAQGIPGTAMPSWSTLSEDERRGLVVYLKSFSARWKEEGAGAPIAVGAPPAGLADAAGKGKKVYETMGCGQCHGATGKGDGPSAAALRDDAGRPIPPFDFTRGGRMKGGSAPADIYRTFTTGLDGTPMPSYAESIPDEQRWQLVAYVQSLAAAAAAPAVTEGVVQAQPLDRAPPLDPADPAWSRAPALRVRLHPLWQRDNAADALEVRALHGGGKLAFLLGWADAKADQNVLRPEDFRDGAAVQFPLKDTPAERDRAFHGMGAKGALVNIWHWKADWQLDVQRFADVADQHPGMHVDMTPFDGETLFLTAAGAGNLMAQRSRRSAAEELNATGFGTLTAQPAESQDAEALGAWADGRWSVVLRRDLATRDGARDAQLRAGGTTHAAFAVWDGSAGDRDGQKSVSTWQEVRIETPGAGGR